MELIWYNNLWKNVKSTWDKYHDLNVTASIDGIVPMEYDKDDLLFSSITNGYLAIVDWLPQVI